MLGLWASMHLPKGLRQSRARLLEPAIDVGVRDNPRMKAPTKWMTDASKQTDRRRERSGDTDLNEPGA